MAPRTYVGSADGGTVLTVTNYDTVGVECRFAFSSPTITG